MRFKFVCWLFLIAGNAFVSVQCEGNDEYSFKKRSAFRSRISGGDEYQAKYELEYPWLVGLQDRMTEKFFCAGSLISNRHVLSAAHCFHQKGDVEATDPYHVMAMLGRFNVSDHDEAESLNSLVWEIFIHPEWNFTDWNSNYDADISVAVLEDLVEFTAFIRPVRLPEASDKTEVVEDGTVVGWGHDNKSSNGHEETPSKIKVPAVLFRKCATDAIKSVGAQSMRTFCAGFLGRSIAPCLGDSGGGFYVEDESKQNSIEGIVSNSAIQDIHGVCKTDNYTTYTIVANFVPWIKEKVQETKEKVFMDMEYTCRSHSEGQDGFLCTAEVSDNPLPDFAIFKLRNFTRNPNDVRELYFDFEKARVIEGIGETFPNLEELDCGGSPNRIERRTFANMTNLKTLNLPNNKLITHHYFDDLVNLEELKLSYCKMPKQPRNLFNVLRNLTLLKISGGATWRILTDETFVKMSKLETLALINIGLVEFSENAFNDLVGLKHLYLQDNSIIKLPNDLFKNLRSLKEINFHDNEIEELSKELFANNLMLEAIFLHGNKIKKIGSNFASLPKIRTIWLWGNVCVNAGFGAEDYYEHKTVRELQESIDTQCKRK